MRKYREKRNRRRFSRETRNPYLVSYLSFALICVISLGLVSLLISINIFKKEQAARDEAKLELISENMHNQLKFMRKVGIGITANSLYYPKYLEENKYYELEMLKNFEQYLSRFSVVDEMLLYYGDDRVFLGSGNISAFDVYFHGFSDADRDKILEWLNSPSWEGFSFLKAQNLYVGLSLDFMGKRENTTVKLCFEIEEDAFAEYIDLIGGISNGTFCLYFGEDCLYSNAKESPQPGYRVKDRTVVGDDNYGLTFVFLPVDSILTGRNYVALTVILIAAIVIWLTLMIYLFAGKSYKPIKLFMDKCRENMACDENKIVSFKDNLAEVGEAIETLLTQHKEAREKLDVEEKRLEEVVLRSFLKGEHTNMISKYAEFIQINLSGAYFFVCSVFFEEELLKSEFTNSMSKLFEGKIRVRAPKASVYVLSRTKPCDMSVICCLRSREDRTAVLESIRKAAEEFCWEPLVECGGVYDNVSKLSASYFESLELLNRAKNERNQDNILPCGIELNSKYVLQFFVFLRAGEEKKALEELRLFIREFEKRDISFLARQYFLAEFMYKITNIVRECHVEVETQFLSLLISAGNLKEFEEAAELVVRQFCEELRAKENESALSESKEITDYIEQHFAEYDISIEGVARILNVSADNVRSSIQRHTGKSYKEYVLSLRMAYSRKLLTEEKLSVEETSRRVGYANASYFIRLFKKEYGVTPADYKLVNEVA